MPQYRAFVMCQGLVCVLEMQKLEGPSLPSTSRPRSRGDRASDRPVHGRRSLRMQQRAVRGLWGAVSQDRERPGAVVMASSPSGPCGASAASAPGSFPKGPFASVVPNPVQFSS